MGILNSFAIKKEQGERGIRNTSINQKNRDLSYDAQQEAAKTQRNSGALTAGVTAATNPDLIAKGLQWAGVGSTPAAAGLTTSAGSVVGGAGSTAIGSSAVTGATTNTLAQGVAGSAGSASASAIPYIGWAIALAGLLGWF